MGSDCFPTQTTSSQDGGYVGPGSASVEVTVDGVHVGPSPALAGSYADLTTLRNEFGQFASQNLTIHAMAANASCNLPVTRFGTGIQPFRAAPYQLVTPTNSVTGEGTASPVGALTITAGQLTLQCSGGDCFQNVLVITIMDAQHIEGYVTGLFADPSDGQTSNTVCTFYVPWRVYQP